MRVHELAKILDVSSSDLMKELKRVRVTVKNHMSALEDKHVRKVMERFEQKKIEEEGKRKKEEARKAEEAHLAEIKRKEEEARRAEEERQAEIRRRKEAMEKAKEEEERKKREEDERKRREEEERLRKEKEEKERRHREEERKRKDEEERKRREKEGRRKVEEKKKETGRKPEFKPKIFPEKKKPFKEAPPEVKKPKIPELKKEEEKARPGIRPRFSKEEILKRKTPEVVKKPRKEKPAKPRLRTVAASISTFQPGEGKEVFTLEKTFKRKTPKEKKTEHRFKPTKLFLKDDFDEFKIKRKEKKKSEKQPFFEEKESTILEGTAAVGVLEAVKPKEIEKQPTVVTIRGEITIAEFAEKIGVSPADIIKKALLLGSPVSINQVLDIDLAELIASDYNTVLEIVPESDEYDVREYITETPLNLLKHRPPVVTIMGHVDHGKTSLLDRIRRSDIVGGEVGGITQHIGAYYVHIPKGDIVFLDTPGHEAFTAMRARGAFVTDIVIVVIAATESLKPQTIEAINHSKDAKVPIIVAINKIDLPGANPEKVKQDLLQYGVVNEELGGETLFVETSAKMGIGIDSLLETILLQAEIMDLKANPVRPAVGAIIESKIDSFRGVGATVLVQKGTLRVGDCFVAGTEYGKVRAMINDRGETVKEATPSYPVEIIGLSGAPMAGDTFVVVPTEKVAHQIATTRAERRRKFGLHRISHISLENLHERIEEGKIKELKMILKADVQGSIEAIKQSLEKIGTEKVKVKIIHSAVGGVNESDVNLAAASNAIIIGFHVRPETTAAILAEQEKVDIKIYHIIYELLDDIKKSMLGLLEPVFKEIILGRAVVKQVFKVSRVGTIAGSYVEEGEIHRDSKVRIFRENIEILDGKVSSLRRVKEDVSKVIVGLECGIGIENFNDVKEGDVIEAYRLEELPREL